MPLLRIVVLTRLIPLTMLLCCWVGSEIELLEVAIVNAFFVVLIINSLQFIIPVTLELMQRFSWLLALVG